MLLQLRFPRQAISNFILVNILEQVLFDLCQPRTCMDNYAHTIPLVNLEYVGRPTTS